MIFDAIVTVIAGILGFVGDLFGVIPLPGFLSQVDGWLEEVGGYAAGVSNIFPISDAVSAAGFVLGIAGIGFVIKVVRIVLSVFTAGGGSAG